jgi:hypothetical protein
MKGHAFTPRSIAALVILGRWGRTNELIAALDYVLDELEDERKKPVAANNTRG